MIEEDDLELLTSKEAAKLLGISVTTFRKMRQNPELSAIEVKLGQRIKYSKRKLLELFYNGRSKIKDKVKLCIFSNGNDSGAYINSFTIDLTSFGLIDPYACLALLVHLIERSRNGKKTELIVSDGEVCKELKYVGFFNHLESFAPLVSWDRLALGNSNYVSAQSLLPITVMKRKGEERRVVEKLLEIFIQHGYSETIGGYLGQVLGELGDNCLTHSNPKLSDRVCFMQAQRYSLGENAKCVIVSIADLGEGIHTTLKTNPKHKDLSDKEAFLSAFRHKFSSWSDEYNRGKGLTDMFSIALGSHSIFRASSGENDFLFNYYNPKNSVALSENKPTLLEAKGTKFGLVLIDKAFTPVHRIKADEILKEEIQLWKKL
jgi:excisionase family DNA binding protein